MVIIKKKNVVNGWCIMNDVWLWMKMNGNRLFVLEDVKLFVYVGDFF